MRILVSFVLFGLLEAAFIAAIIAIGRRDARLTRAPWLDVVVSLLTWVPWVLSWILSGFAGVVGCVLGQIAAMQAFCYLDRRMRAPDGPAMESTLNRLTSRFDNNLALLATLPALPAFLLIRFSQLTTYPILVRTVRLPPYKHSEWVSVSRQKFSGLVGHDLVWCLYCDWMTGIYALGGEMLRNLESFWCPIRFYPGKKCENCKLDFPDIPEWVAPDATIEDVQAKLAEKYEGRRWNSWWGHPDRKSDPKNES